MSAARRARRALDKQLRLEGKPRAIFRVQMMKDGRLSESVRVDHQDARAVIHAVEQLLEGLKGKLHAAQPPGLVPGPSPQTAAARYFSAKEEA